MANFTSAPLTYNISGTINGPGGAGAGVSLSGASTATTSADGSGNYNFSGLSNGSYTITPTNSGYSFGPASQAVTISGGNAVANFTSALVTYGISGTITGTGGAGATLSLMGASTATITADGSGNFSFSGLLNGSYIVTPANTGYVFTPVSQIVVVNGSDFTGLSFATVSGCPTCDTIWPATTVPTVADSGDATATELGVKFRADSDGYITGLRFYKASTNTGTHVGHLWTSTGTLLGSATFTSEGVAGWQQVLFATPIPVVANTTYVASYFAPSGHYSGDSNFFATAGVDNPPLHALADGVDGADGVYLYSADRGVPDGHAPGDKLLGGCRLQQQLGLQHCGNHHWSWGGRSHGQLDRSVDGNDHGRRFGQLQLQRIGQRFLHCDAEQCRIRVHGEQPDGNHQRRHAMNVNFSSALQTYTSVERSAGREGRALRSSLTRRLHGDNHADGSGNYSFTGLANGSYTVTPSKSGFFFSPPSQSVTISGANITAVNFSSLLTVTSVSLSPASVIGGSTSTGTITLSGPAPAGGAVVTLSSSDTAAAQVPASVTVAANASSASFTVATNPVLPRHLADHFRDLWKHSVSRPDGESA